MREYAVHWQATVCVVRHQNDGAPDDGAAPPDPAEGPVEPQIEAMLAELSLTLDAPFDPGDGNTLT